MIKLEIKDSVAIITLNRPEKRNALNEKIINDLTNALLEIEKNNTIKLVILTGEGKAFCAGADLEYLRAISEKSVNENIEDSNNLAFLYKKIFNFEKPVIAAVNGAAIAGGCGLASVCDFIIASPNSKFGYTEVKIGFVPAIVSYFLIQRVGYVKAKQLLLSGQIISAEKAKEIGLIDYISDDVLISSLEMALLLSNNYSSSIKTTKHMLNEINSMSYEDAINYLIKVNVAARTTEDFKSGINNFLTKRILNER